MPVPNPLLRDATVQEIQLELIRRTSFNAMEGEKVAESLLRQRDLWIAVILDRQGLPNYNTPQRLLMSGLIKLRDLPYNLWNADVLYVLTASVANARRLKAIIDEEDWGGEVWITEDQDEIDQAIGSGRHEHGLVQVWWD